MHSIDKASFLAAAAKGANFIPLVHSWPADLETPLTTWLKVSRQKLPGVLLESVEGGENLGRWSVVAVNPLWTATARGNHLIREWRDGRSNKEIGNPFDVLRNWLAPYTSEPIPGLPPLGQLFGMWGYEMIEWIEEKVPVHKRVEDDLPDGIWMFMDSTLIFDQVKRVVTAVVYGDLSLHNSPEDAFESSLGRIKELEGMMKQSLQGLKPIQWKDNLKSCVPTNNNFTKLDYESAVNIAKNYISSGDIFQLVLSQRFSARVFHEPFELYRSLRMINPSPYMAFFDFGDWQLIGSSPEVMVKAKPSAEGIIASLRPIAGTRPRGINSKEDLKFEKELINDPKEIAEHVMLVDLGRNDLGRVCLTGSIAVKELMVIEKYSHVMHIVSEVEGLLSKDMDVWDLLKASFPAGTVSGAPKIRAMQLINELEKDARGPYSGVYGSMDLTGALNTAITIRTMIVKPHPETGIDVQVQAGAGIVADSVPSSEYQETLNKANGLLKSIACLEEL